MRPPLLTVRPATLDDVFDVAEIQINGWRTTYRGVMPDSVLENLDLLTSAAGWEAQLRRRSLSMNVVMAGLRVVGFAAYGAPRDTDSEAQTEELYALYIASDSQRMGAGSALLNGLLSAAKERGTRKLTLWVAEGNQAALSFYAKHQLLPDGTRKLDSNLTDSPIAELRCACSFS
jgi:ribosomal protein S18 acetylase RimI-like enzyme